MPNPSLRAGERSIRHQVVIPESLDRQLRARCVLDGNRKISEVIRAAIESYLDNEPAVPGKVTLARKADRFVGQASNYCEACFSYAAGEANKRKACFDPVDDPSQRPLTRLRRVFFENPTR